jgi:hypothetical protein
VRELPLDLLLKGCRFEYFMNMLYNQRRIELTDTPPPVDDEVNAALKEEEGQGRDRRSGESWGQGSWLFVQELGVFFLWNPAPGILPAVFFHQPA